MDGPPGAEAAAGTGGGRLPRGWLSEPLPNNGGSCTGREAANCAAAEAACGVGPAGGATPGRRGGDRRPWPAPAPDPPHSSALGALRSLGRGRRAAAAEAAAVAGVGPASSPAPRSRRRAPAPRRARAIRARGRRRHRPRRERSGRGRGRRRRAGPGELAGRRGCAGRRRADARVERGGRRGGALRGGRRGRERLRDDAAVRIGLRALLELDRALGRATGPFAQALDLARLGEVEHRQDPEPEDRREAGVRADLLEETAERAARISAVMSAPRRRRSGSGSVHGGVRIGLGIQPDDLGTRRQLGHLRSQPRRVALQHQQPDLVEHLLYDLRRARLALGAQDLLGRRRLRALVGVEELLVELLARAAGRRSRSRCRARARGRTARSCRARGP